MTGQTSTNDAARPGDTSDDGGQEGKTALLATAAQRLIHAARRCSGLLRGR